MKPGSIWSARGSWPPKPITSSMLWRPLIALQGKLNRRWRISNLPYSFGPRIDITRVTTRTSPSSRKTPGLPNCFTRIGTAPGPDGSPPVSRRSPLQRAKPVRIVAIGGGTDLSTLLRGLKGYVAPQHRHNSRNPIADLAAIVTVTDDGGSSGRLRREYSVLPPGDIRNCMVAMSEDEALLSRLFQYRFQSGLGLRGHSFGNLFLAALSQVTGDFNHAVRVSGEVLAIRGRIFPSTNQLVTLEAALENGTVIAGETQIGATRKRIHRVRLVPRRVKPLPEVLDAIAEANLVVLGPGSLFTS